MIREQGIETARAALLATYLKQLKLPAIKRSYVQVAREARQASQAHEEFLLALVEVEVSQREVSRQRRRLAQARFPVLKALESFQFGAVPSLNKAEVLELARGGYIAEKENLIFVGGRAPGRPIWRRLLGSRPANKGSECVSWERRDW